MTKYLLQVDNPPPGEDWRTVVPGRYLYDVNGITATLVTDGGGAFPNCPDASGNGNNATYSGAASAFVPGLVPGNDALQRIAALGDQIVSTHPIVDVTSPFTVVVWLELDAPGPHDIGLAFYSVGPPTNALGWDLRIPVGFPDRWFVTGTRNMAGNNTTFETGAGTVPYDSAPHMVAVTFDPGGAPQNNLYLDGVLIPWDITDVAFISNGPSTGWNFNVGYSPLITDEIAIIPGALTAGQVAALYATGGAFATYEPAALALSPLAYYHLDGAAISTGRQPSLIVTDGTHDVLAIPTGFQAVGTPGPYRYSWQPNLNADTQSSDGTLTTVAVPQIVIPAGYVIETRTLDLQPTDQWSNITLWWDDTAQVTDDGPPDFLYPPGAFYVYQQLGTAP